MLWTYHNVSTRSNSKDTIIIISLVDQSPLSSKLTGILVVVPINEHIGADIKMGTCRLPLLIPSSPCKGIKNVFIASSVWIYESNSTRLGNKYNCYIMTSTTNQSPLAYWQINQLIVLLFIMGVIIIIYHLQKLAPSHQFDLLPHLIWQIWSNPQQKTVST